MGLFDFLKRGKQVATNVANSTTLDEKVVGMAQDVAGQASEVVNKVADSTTIDEKVGAVVGNVTEQVGNVAGSAMDKAQDLANSTSTTMDDKVVDAVSGVVGGDENKPAA